MRVLCHEWINASYNEGLEAADLIYFALVLSLCLSAMG
jgi:hypothetical protein